MTETTHTRTLEGIVVSDNMRQTIVVRVDRRKQHPKYRKYFTVSKRYHVHDERGEFHTGDRVTFIECRPLSKLKRWRVTHKVK